jgi:hypothetical protein
MADFCPHCGSLIVNGKCSGHKGICPEGAKRRRSVDFHKPGYVRNRKTGMLIDRETGTTVSTRRG